MLNPVDEDFLDGRDDLDQAEKVRGICQMKRLRSFHKGNIGGVFGSVRGTGEFDPIAGLWRIADLKQQHKEKNTGSPRVFLNQNGEELRGHREWSKPALKGSGVGDNSWHCNRHTFASRLVMASGDLRTVGDF